MVGIYKITSPSGKVNIGQSWNVERRIRHYHYPKGCPDQIKLHNSFKKHGVKNHTFEIIHELPDDVTQEVLNTYETLYWQLYIDAGSKMLNMREPGSNGKFLPETLKKMSESGKRRMDKIGRLTDEEKQQRKIQSRLKAAVEGYHKIYRQRPEFKAQQARWDATHYAKVKYDPDWKAKQAKKDKARYDKIMADPERRKRINDLAKANYHKRMAAKKLLPSTS